MKSILGTSRGLLDRRSFLKGTLLTSGALAFPHVLRSAAPSGDFRLAFIGAGGRGGVAIRGLTAQHYVAFADVDEKRAAGTFTNFPAVPRYRDFRRLLDRHANGIDGVVISTPDHSHYAVAMACMALGKHVFIEKPLAPTAWECRELERTAARQGVKAQLGIQGHSMEALRVLREWIDAGVAGPIHTVYLWSDRLNPQRSPWSDSRAPLERVPETLDWELWLSDRPPRAYNSSYVAGGWRNWWGFGSGAIGDIGVHMFDAVEFALNIGFPSLVEAEVPVIGPYTTPPWSRVRWEYPRAERPPIVVHWCNGTRDGRLVKPPGIPHVPHAVLEQTGNGMAFVGDGGTLFIPDMRASSRPRIFPLEREREILASPPERSLPRPKGGHAEDWFDAIRRGHQPSAHLGYGAALTEMVLIGTLAQRTGKPIRWNRTKMIADGVPEASEFVRPPSA